MASIPARLKFAGLVILTAVAAACSEKLDNSAGCPLLCPDEGSQIETVTLDAVSFDTTISALTGQGTEQSLLLATRGDTLDARAIIRFDTIPARFRAVAGDSATTEITVVDSVLLQLRVDTVNGKLPGPVTLDLFDVNSDAADSLIAPIAALFTPERLITSATFERAALKDTINVRIPGAAILARKGGPMRIGIRARGQGSVQLLLASQEGAGDPTQLSFRVSPDTTVARIRLQPYSRTPEGQVALSTSLADYTLLVKGTATGPANQLNIGGLPARRVYLRFNVPAFLLDSVNVIRATLLLTQIPNTALDPGDTIRIIPHVSLATGAVTDIAKASQITAVATTDTLRVPSGGTGVRNVEVATVMTVWRGQTATETPRAIVLLTVREGESPLEARFYSIEAAPELRPRLRISYSARKSTGLP